MARRTDVVPQIKRKWTKITTSAPTVTPNGAATNDKPAVESRTVIATGIASSATTITHRNYQQGIALHREGLDQLIGGGGGSDHLFPVIRVYANDSGGASEASVR